MTQPQDFLEGQLLIAMPSMADSRFERSVVYLCAHSEQGALGLVVNKPLDNISFSELLDQLDIDEPIRVPHQPVYFGGPVETSRGFVLHSMDYDGDEATLQVSPQMGLTATLSILRAIAQGEGPDRSLLALGYAGWGAGQLENEIQQNGWLHCPFDPEIVFGTDQTTKWQRAIAMLGVDVMSLSSTAGHA